MGQAKKLIDRAWELMEGGRLDALPEVFAAECDFRMPGGALRGPAAIGAMCKGWWGAFPDLKHEILGFVEAGDSVAMEIRVTGTHTGAMISPKGTIPATGKKVDWRSCDYIRLENGRIVAWHAYFDQLEFLGQLGVLPA